MRAIRVSHRAWSAASIAIGALVFALTGFAGEAGGAPPTGKVGVTTLTGGPVGVSTPLDPDNPVPVAMPINPASSASFTQKAGEVVTITMASTFDEPDPDSLFCDVHAAVHLSPEEAGFTTIEQHSLAQRGGPWWDLVDRGANSTRTIPAPETDTTYTVEGVAWMDSPSGIDGCFGTSPSQTVTVSTRISIVKLRN